MGQLLGGLRVSGIQVDQWVVAGQDEGEVHKTAEKGT